MKLDQTTGPAITQLWTTLEPGIQQSTSLEAAAQALATALHTEFTDSTVLARVYVTVPFEHLPRTNQAFVRALASSGGASASLQGLTPVLSLIGTHGQEPAWNDRRTSKGHVGIPLISAAFVDAIPMISLLLRELGVPLAWIDTYDARQIVRTIGTTLGLFYVDDAAQATDDQDRKVIPAQDFVSAYGVKTVFGTGGAYPTGQMLVIILFSRDRIPRTTAELFLPLADLFKRTTTPLIAPAKVFAAP